MEGSGTSDCMMAGVRPEHPSGVQENKTSHVASESVLISASSNSRHDGSVDMGKHFTHEGPTLAADLVDQDVKQHIPSRLFKDVPTSPEIPPKMAGFVHKDQSPPLGTSFDEHSRPTPMTHGEEKAFDQDLGGDEPYVMHRFSLYETASRYYLIGGDIKDSRFKVLKIDRTVDDTVLSIAEDEMVYTKTEMNQLLNTVDDGNKNTGGLKLKCSPWGLLGFIRFTAAYYMLLITKRSQVAMLGGHYIYQIDGTELVPLATSSSTRLRVDKHPEEARFIGILGNLDLSRSFYFSYTYDITRTLQHNIVRQRQNLQADRRRPAQHDVNEMFVWNHHLLQPAKVTMGNSYDWCLPIIHGFIDQAGEW